MYDPTGEYRGNQRNQESPPSDEVAPVLISDETGYSDNDTPTPGYSGTAADTTPVPPPAFPPATGISRDSDSDSLVKQSLQTQTQSQTQASASASTVTTTVTKSGESVLQVESQEGFEIGMTIVVGVGSRAESRVLEAFGSLVLAHPLVRSHPVGTLVAGYWADSSENAKIGAPPRSITEDDWLAGDSPYAQPSSIPLTADPFGQNKLLATLDFTAGTVGSADDIAIVAALAPRQTDDGDYDDRTTGETGKNRPMDTSMPSTLGLDSVDFTVQEDAPTKSQQQLPQQLKFQYLSPSEAVSQEVLDVQTTEACIDSEVELIVGGSNDEKEGVDITSSATPAAQIDALTTLEEQTNAVTPPWKVPEKAAVVEAPITEANSVAPIPTPPVLTLQEQQQAQIKALLDDDSLVNEDVQEMTV